jgi:hypothetical protein
MLKVALSKSNKDQSSLSTQSQLKLPQDSSKLEKQLKSFVTKLQNGATLLPSVYRVDSTTKEEESLEFKRVDEPSSESKSETLTKQVPQVKTRSKLTSNVNDVAKNEYANRSKVVTGEEEDDGEQQQLQQQQSRNLPSFEDVMEIDDLKKNRFGFDLDDL